MFGFVDDMIWDFISNVNSIICNVMFYDVLKVMKFVDFVVWLEVCFSGMVKMVLMLVVMIILKELML